MAASSNSDEQGHDEHASAAGFEFEVDFSTSPEAPAQDFMFGEQQLLTSSSTPEHDSSAPEGAARNLLIIPAPLGSRNTVFFLDNCRRLAVTHYQTELTFTAPAAVTTPQFSLQFYIRSNESMFNTRDNLMTILGWCEKLLLLPAIEHLLHELGLSGTSIRFEVYDGFDSFKAIIAHSRDEREHRHMYIEYLDCQKELTLASMNVQRGNLALHPAVHPRVGGRLSRGKQLQKSIMDLEAAKRHPTAWNQTAGVTIQKQAPALAPGPLMRQPGSQPAAGPSTQLSGSMPPPPLPAHAMLARQQAAGLITQPPSSALQALTPFRAIAPAPPRHVQGPASRSSIPGRPPGAPSPSPRPSTTGLPAPAPNAPAARIAKSGSPLNPLERSTNTIAPASYLLAPHQPYHHAVIVIDEHRWQQRGLIVLKFDKEKDWTDTDDVGSLDEGDYVAERVSCYADGRVEQRTTERNTPEWMKLVRIGEIDLEQEMEIVSKRWLGEVLVEIIKGGYFAHLGQ